MRQTLLIINAGIEAIPGIHKARELGLYVVVCDGKQDAPGFEIADDGIGIEEERLNRALEIGKSSKGSSGFGLYYCKMFVEDNNGQLIFNSTGKGKGAVVRVTFDQQEMAPYS